MKTESDSNDQWCVSSVDEFLLYCCPDCDFKEKNKDDFIKHAISQHPMSANYLGQIIIKQELFEDYSGELKNEIVPDYDYTEFLNDNNTDDSYSDILPEPEINITTYETITQIVNEGKKKWACNICHTFFTIKQSAKQHVLNIHKGTEQQDEKKTAKNTIKCETCQKVYHNETNYLKHEIKHLSVIHKEGSFICELCGKEFNGTSFSLVPILRKHNTEVHGGKKDNKCESCGKSFSEARCLKHHIYTVHEGHKDYKCESCGKSFTVATSLKIHIRTVHEGHKDYQCDLCGKAFGEKSSLTKHGILVHTGIRKLQCSKCEKKFSQQQKLKLHIKTVHEGRKDYQCVDCGKFFGSPNTMERHRETVHEGVKKFKCHLCSNAYGQSHELKKHLINYHKEIIPKNKNIFEIQNEFLPKIQQPPHN